jgi:hypothetical protein
VARTARWREGKISDSFLLVELSSWKYFHDFVTQELLNFPNYIWRGQRDESWSLQSSLDRVLPVNVAAKQRTAREHLGRFVSSTRGRRGSNPSKIDRENEWWALGQHHGLLTPLLDWTDSPFAALYFAFQNAGPSGKRPRRAVWAISTASIVKKNEELVQKAKETPGAVAPTLEIVRPLQDENARLVAQAGLFTRVPLGMTVDQWIKINYGGDDKTARLVKVVVPSDERATCLRALNRMNINHLSLFPDVYGSTIHCNRSLEISRY